MVEDLLPPPPKKNTSTPNEGDGGILPPPPKKKVETEPTSTSNLPSSASPSLSPSGETLNPEQVQSIKDFLQSPAKYVTPSASKPAHDVMRYGQPIIDNSKNILAKPAVPDQFKDANEKEVQRQQDLNKRMRDDVMGPSRDFFIKDPESMNRYFNHLEQEGYGPQEIEQAKKAVTGITTQQMPIMETSYVEGFTKNFDEALSGMWKTMDNASRIIEKTTGLPRGGAFEKLAEGLETRAAGLKDVPENITGQVTKGVAQTIPLMMQMMYAPELEIPGAIEVSKLATTLGGNAFVNDLAERTKNKDITFSDVAKSSLEGAEEAAKGQILYALGYGSSKVGKAIEEATGSGVLGGLSGSLINSTGFAGMDAAEQYAKTGKVDMNQVLSSFGTGIALSAPEIARSVADAARGTAMKNFLTTSPENVNEIKNMDINPEELRNKSIDLGEQAEKETDTDKKNELLLAKRAIDKVVDVHAIANDVLEHSKKYIDEIKNNDQLTDEQKQGFIDRINKTVNDNDPKIQEAKIISDKIKEQKKQLEDLNQDHTLDDPIKEAIGGLINDKIKEYSNQLKDIFLPEEKKAKVLEPDPKAEQTKIISDKIKDQKEQLRDLLNDNTLDDKIKEGMGKLINDKIKQYSDQLENISLPKEKSEAPADKTGEVKPEKPSTDERNETKEAEKADETKVLEDKEAVSTEEGQPSLTEEQKPEELESREVELFNANENKRDFVKAPEPKELSGKKVTDLTDEEIKNLGFKNEHEALNSAKKRVEGAEDMNAKDMPAEFLNAASEHRAEDVKAREEEKSKPLTPEEDQKLTERILKSKPEEKSLLEQTKDFIKDNHAVNLAKDIVKAFHPFWESTSREAATMIRKRSGEMKQALTQIAHTSEELRSLFNRGSYENNVRFILGIENPEKYGAPEGYLKEIADQYRTRLQDVFKQISSIKNIPYIEDYFPHFWEDPEKAKKIFTELYSKKPFEGGKNFLKQRFYSDIAEGLDAGLKLKTDNPEELVRLAEINAWKFKMANNLFDDLQESDMLKFARTAKDAPDGWKAVDDPLFKARLKTEALKVKGEDINTSGIVDLGKYYMPEGAAEVLERYLSRGLAGKPAFEMIRDFNNTLNQFQLGLSFFHGTTTTLESAFTTSSIGLNEILRGNINKGLKDLSMGITVIPGAIDTAIKGAKGMKDYREGIMNDTTQMLITANADVGLSKFYRTDALENFKKGMERGDYKHFNFYKENILKLGLPKALLEYVAKPLFEHYVPMLKVGNFIKLAQSELANLKDPTQEQIDKTIQKSWDSIDNRFGQMVYDNIFWKKTMKDLGFVSVRSLGWTGGSIREIGGGVGDVPKSLSTVIKGQGISPRTAWLVSVIGGTALYGAVTQYLLTGKGPEEIEDYFHPKTGEKDKNGEDARIALPTYTKDMLNYSTKPVETLKNKAAPLITDIANIYKNEDFYKRRIYDEDDPAYKKGMDILEYEAAQTVPFAYRNKPGQENTIAETLKQKFTTKQGVMQQFGLMPVSSMTQAQLDLRRLIFEKRPKVEKQAKALYKQGNKKEAEDMMQKVYLQIQQAQQEVNEEEKKKKTRTTTIRKK